MFALKLPLAIAASSVALATAPPQKGAMFLPKLLAVIVAVPGPSANALHSPSHGRTPTGRPAIPTADTVKRR
jgi:hypothetical protein